MNNDDHIKLLQDRIKGYEKAIVRQSALKGYAANVRSLKRNLADAQRQLTGLQMRRQLENAAKVFHPTNLGLTKQQIVDTVNDIVEEPITVDQVLDAQAEQFVCLYYDTLIECAGRGDDFTANAIGTMLSDWVADVVKI